MFILRKLPVEFEYGTSDIKSDFIIFGVNRARFRGFLRIFQRSTSLPRSCLRRARRASIATNRIRLKPKSKPANIEHWRYGTKPLVSRCQVRSALDYLAIGTHTILFNPCQMSSKNIKEEHVWNTSGSDQTNPAFLKECLSFKCDKSATSMLRCVLGISGYLSFWRKWRHQISTRSWYRSQWPSAGMGLRLWVWTEHLRYLIVPNGVDTSQEGWKHIEGI